MSDYIKVYESLYNMLFEKAEWLDKSITIEGFTFTRDLGLKYAEVRNPSGNDTWYGNYRWLELSRNGVSLNFAIFGEWSWGRQDEFGNDFYQLYFFVVRGDSISQHASIQIDLQANLSAPDNNKMELSHLGNMEAGTTGGVKRKIVIDCMQKNAPYLLAEDSRIVLGYIEMNTDLSLTTRKFRTCCFDRQFTPITETRCGR